MQKLSDTSGTNKTVHGTPYVNPIPYPWLSPPSTIYHLYLKRHLHLSLLSTPKPYPPSLPLTLIPHPSLQPLSIYQEPPVRVTTHPKPRTPSRSPSLHPHPHIKHYLLVLSTSLIFQPFIPLPNLTPPEEHSPARTPPPRHLLLLSSRTHKTPSNSA